MTFAPRDTMPIDITAKDNLHGLGYRALNPKTALQDRVKSSSAVKAYTKGGNKISFRGQVLFDYCL